MKQILIIAGPNGAGKTTFAEAFLPHEAACPEFVNADLIAAGLSPFRPERAAIAASRLMLARIRELAETGTSFAFETTLSGRGYLRMIPRWQASGYRVTLHFLKLPDPEIAIRRVRHRTRLGGHAIPDATIRRRFARGWFRFEDYYKSIVDHWVLYDASRMPPAYLDRGPRNGPPQAEEARGDYNQPTPADPEAMDRADIEAALKRAGEKALARARAAGLEPVFLPPGEIHPHLTPAPGRTSGKTNTPPVVEP